MIFKNARTGLAQSIFEIKKRFKYPRIGLSKNKKVSISLQNSAVRWKMKKSNQSKKPSKKLAAPAKENDASSIAKRMRDIEVKLKEKVVNAQKIFNAY